MLSIREIVVDENMVILGGNMRYRALKELEKNNSNNDSKGFNRLTKERIYYKR